MRPGTGAGDENAGPHLEDAAVEFFRPEDVRDRLARRPTLQERFEARQLLSAER